MYEYDVKVTASGHPCRLDIGLYLDAECLGLQDDCGSPKATEHTYDQGKVEQVQVEEGAQDDQKRDAGQRDDQVGQSHEKGVDQSAVVGGNRADRGRDGDGHEGRRYPQNELRSRTGKQLA